MGASGISRARTSTALFLSDIFRDPCKGRRVIGGVQETSDSDVT